MNFGNAQLLPTHLSNCGPANHIIKCCELSEDRYTETKFDTTVRFEVDCKRERRMNSLSEDLEEIKYAEGYKDGTTDGKSTELFQNGFESGNREGFSFGLEVGYYEEICRQKLNEISTANRLMKKLQNFIVILGLFPQYNDHKEDFDSHIQSIRSMQKQLSSLLALPNFVQVASDKSSSTKVSNEW